MVGVRESRWRRGRRFWQKYKQAVVIWLTTKEEEVQICQNVEVKEEGRGGQGLEEYVAGGGDVVVEVGSR